MALSQPASKTNYTMQYANLKGVDYSCDMTETDRTRSPEMINMISDDGGNPVKRIGWRKVVSSSDVLDFLVREEGAVEYIYTFTKTGLKKYKTDGTAVTTDFPTAPTAGFSYGSFAQYNGNVLVFAMSGNDNYLYEITSAGKVVTLKTGAEDDTAELANLMIPITVISRSADGSGGQTYYDTNLLTRYRKITFVGDSTSTTYKLYPENTWDVSGYNRYIIKGSVQVVETTSTEEKILVEGTDWNYGTATTITGWNESGVATTFQVTDPAITFTAAHPTSNNEANISIRFKPFINIDYEINGTTRKLGTYYPKMRDVMKPKASAVFGYKAMDRLFVAGGIELNTVYFSDVEDCTYFPDLNYITIGQSTNGVVGFHRVSGYLVALKDDASAESTSFLIQGYVYDEGGTEERTAFGVTAMTSGVGAISSKAMMTLADEPLFLSRTGIYGIVSTSTENEKMVQNRSLFLNKKLLAEENLGNACACVWNNYYVLAVNNHAYVLDGRHTSTSTNGNSTYQYEGYYWENIPAVRMQGHHGELWFIDASGNICRFNTDITNNTAYQDNGTLSNGKLTGGVAINAKWTSKLDDDYRPHYLKTMNKRGAMVTIQPYERTSVAITLVKNGVTSYAINPYYFDISDWSNIDYSTFTVSTSRIAEDAFIKKKMKKYKRLQIVVENNELDEPFGIIEVTYTYTLGNLSK